MAATDKIRLLPTIVPGAADNVRAFTQADNNRRTERYQLRVTGQVDITAGGTGIINRGSILGALTDIGYNDGGTDKIVLDARLARFIGEALAPSALPATRLAGAGIQAATQLSEIVPLWMSAKGTGNPNETKYVEVNKQLQQQPFITPLRQITRLATGGALAGTVTNLQATVEQVCDDLLATPPWLSPFVRQIVQNVNAANPSLRVDLRGSRYIRGIAIQQDSTLGEDTTIINSLVLRGDQFALIGENPVPYTDLQDMMAEEQGGAVARAVAPGYLFIDFCRYGRLSTMWNPYQDTNLRLELNVQPSTVAGNSNSVVRVAILEYERTAATVKDLPINI